jgi:hypothetical protein
MLLPVACGDIITFVMETEDCRSAVEQLASQGDGVAGATERRGTREVAPFALRRDGACGRFLRERVEGARGAKARHFVGGS